MTATWVVGASGLLGSAVSRALPDAAPARVRWATPDAAGDLASGIRELVERAAGGPWRILWCAGSGTTSTSPTHLENELATFQGMLDTLAALPEAQRENGLVVYASSAGGLYGGAGDGPFDETSTPRPLGAYGEAKLAAENALRALTEASGVRALVLRIANLYGPGQDLTKPQGLISRLAVSTVARTTLSVFVPLDTLRDYIYVDDAAALLVAAADRAQTAPGLWNLKILCSGSAASIAAVLAEFRRVSGTRPPVVTGTSGAASLQSRDLRLHSSVWDDLDVLATTTLAVGIGRTVADVRRSWLAGRLAGAAQ